MGSDTLLRAACERAFTVAREGVEASPSIDAPEPLQSFLYVARLPRRAINAAQKVVDNDEAFRSRVAEGVNEGEVGRAGFLWLKRPDGWKAEFEELKKNGGKSSKQSVGASGVAMRNSPTIPPPPGFEPDQFVNGSEDTAEVSGLPDSSKAEAGDEMGEVNAIEHELSSLRGLVDRLATERKVVSEGSPSEESATESAALFDDDIVNLQKSLDQVRSELQGVVQDRDEARRKHSKSLTHQLELEKELTKLRQGQGKIDAARAESNGKVLEAREEVARIKANRDEVQREKESALEQIAKLNGDLHQLRGDLKASKAETVDGKTQIDEILRERNAAQTEVQRAEARAERLVVTNEDLSRRIVESEQEIERLRVELDGFADVARRADSLQSEVDELTGHLSEERARHGDTEARLESAHLEQNGLKVDISTVKADRDAIAEQVGTLQQSLSEALEDLGQVRLGTDADRQTIHEIGGERDDLKVELARLEEIDSERTKKLDELVAQQASFAAQKQLSSDLEEKVGVLEAETNKAKTDLARLLGERDKAREELATRQTEFEDLTQKVQILESGSASSANDLRDAQSSLEDIRVERETLATQLTEADQKAAALAEERQKVQDQLAEALSNSGTIQSEIESQRTLIENQKAEIASERSRAEDYKTASETHEKALIAARKELLEIKKSPEPVVEATPEQPAKAPLDKAVPALTGEPPVASPNPKADVPEPAVEPEKTNTVVGHAAPAGEKLAEVSPIVSSPAEPSAQAKDPSEQDKKPEAPAAAVSASDPGQPGSITKSDISDGSGVASLIRSVPDPDPLADPDPTTMAPGKPTPVVGPQVAVPPTGEGTSDAVSMLRPPSVVPDTGENAVAAPSDDLDEVSSLLSEKVNSFDGDADPNSPASEGANDAPKVAAAEKTASPLSTVERNDVTFFSDRSGNPEPTIGPPPSVFSTSELEKMDDAREAPDSDVTFQPPADASIATVSPLQLASDDDEESVLVPAERRTISIPEDVSSRGGVDVARFVVESPEVVLLVDGDGVAKMGWSSRSVSEQREALVSWLADLTASTGASSDVVFDGRMGDDSELPSSRVVRIRLSTPPTEPAAALDELVDAYPLQFPIAVVSDDTSLTSSIVSRGAVHLSNAQLLDLFTPE